MVRTAKLVRVFALVLVAGCASMPGSRSPLGDGTKFEVGNPDHVNLWPVADVNLGAKAAISALWPVFAYNPGERLAVRPVFSYYPGHEFNFAWPLMSFDLAGGNPSWVGPFWKNGASGGIFPLTWWGPEGSGVLPLYGYHSGTDGTEFISIPFSRAADRNGRSRRVVVLPVLSGWRDNELGGTDVDLALGVVSWTTDSNGVVRSHSVVPLYEWDTVKGEYNALLLAQYHRGKPGYGPSHMVLPFYEVDGRKRECDVLFGLGGGQWDAAGGGTNHWAIPFYSCQPREHTFLCPLFYKSPDSFWLPWLLSGVNKGGHEGVFLLGLWGYNVETNPANALAPYAVSHWSLPAYYSSRGFDSDRVRGLLDHPDPAVFHDPATWGHRASAKTCDPTYRNSWIVVPLLTAGNEKLTVCGDVVRTTPEPTNKLARAIWDDQPGEVRSRDFAIAPTGRVDVRLERTYGTFFLHKGRNRRFVSYEGDRRIRDSEAYAWYALPVLGEVSGSRSRLDGTSRKTRRFLYRLYDYEEENGAVTLDIFPGFTHVSRPDGFTSSAFLWRLFRWRHDPATGEKALDLLYIPCYRHTPGK